MLMVAMLLHAPISANLRSQPKHLAVLQELGWQSPLSRPAFMKHALARNEANL